MENDLDVLDKRARAFVNCVDVDSDLAGVFWKRRFRGMEMFWGDF
jgi:hypothetical protein